MPLSKKRKRKEKINEKTKFKCKFFLMRRLLSFYSSMHPPRHSYSTPTTIFLFCNTNFFVYVLSYTLSSFFCCLLIFSSLGTTRICFELQVSRVCYICIVRYNLRPCIRMILLFLYTILGVHLVLVYICEDSLDSL